MEKECTLGSDRKEEGEVKSGELEWNGLKEWFPLQPLSPFTEGAWGGGAFSLLVSE